MSGRFGTRAIGSALVVAAAGIAAGAPGCSDAFPETHSQAHFVVTLEQGQRGAPDARLPLSFDATTPITFKVQAIRADGTPDDAFEGFVRVSSKPGTVASLAGPNTDGRNVRLVHGVADGVTASLVAAYGDTRLWVEDLGYVPGDPAEHPECANGVDDNGNGLIDYPADPGCAYANDDTEDGGSYVAGVSDVLYFTAPRIADVRGINQGGGATAFPHEQVQIDTGYRGATQPYAFSTIVTRVSSDGFYATDLGDADVAHGGRGFSSVFAFNFSAPPRMRICDRLKSFGGTASDFYGFTEIGYPTWTLEEWDPQQRPCFVPEPTVLTIDQLNTNVSTAALLRLESSLVRVETAGTVQVFVPHHFGPGAPQPPDYKPTDDATNCDLNRDGKVDFTAGTPEGTCSAACSADSAGCAEWSTYQSRSEFRLMVLDRKNLQSIQANASTAAQFDPVAARGAPIRSFSGTLRYFSGGNQFTIEARCIDDIVTDLSKAPLTSDTACVHARTTSDLNSGSN